MVISLSSWVFGSLIGRLDWLPSLVIYSSTTLLKCQAIPPEQSAASRGGQERPPKPCGTFASRPYRRPLRPWREDSGGGFEPSDPGVPDGRRGSQRLG